MRKIALITILFSALILKAQPPHNDYHWQLLWEDDFEYFNDNIWYKANYCRHENEPQLYLNDNIWTSKGNLVIRIKDDSTFCTKFDCDDCICYGCDNILYKSTSGWVETKVPFVNKYGYIEARIKIPYRNGLWPAFWTFKADKNIDNACEIDIFELYGCKGNNHIETNIHRDYDKTIPNDTATLYLQKHDLKNFTYEDWHTYAIEWDPIKIIWYVDDSPIRTLYNHNISNYVKLILNVAAQNTKKCSLPKTHFQDYMLVDYVRTYKLKCNNYIAVHEIPDYSTYDFSEKKSISLSGASSVPNSSNITLRASDFIELLPGFEVPADSELYLDVSPCGEEVQ